MPPIPIPAGQKGPRFGGWQLLSPEEGRAQIYHEARRGGPMNMGCRTGTVFFAIDLDNKDGVDGSGNFMAWCQAHGIDLAAQLELCPYAITGGGGLHLCYAMPPGVEIPTKANVLRLPGGPEKNGVDVRGVGGQIVVAPSHHPTTGQAYYWPPGCAPWERAFPPAPQALIDALVAENTKVRKPDVQARVPQPDDTPARDKFEDDISRVSGRRTKSRTEARKAKQILELLDGQPIATEGGGHDAYLGVTELIGRKWPFADVGVLMEYLRPGIVAREGKTTFHDVERMLRGAQERYRAEAAERESTWRKLLDITDEGGVKVSSANVLIILREHDDWQGVWAYNTRNVRPMFMRPPPLLGDKTKGPRPIKETDDIKIVEWFQLEMSMNVKSKDVREAVIHLCEQRPFDPFLEYLRSELPVWDGKRRNVTWLIRYMGAEDTPLNRIYARKFLIAAVARAMQPGCKVDNALIAVGEQGIGKSSAFRALFPKDRAGEWFSDRLSSLTNKDALQEIHGPVLMEMSELQVVKQVREQEDHKMFMTIQVDKFRKPYARDVSEHPRSLVFCGTTNDFTPFRDASGARRWWAFIAGQCDIPGLNAVAPQLWAEAVHDYDHNEQWWLTPDEEKMAALSQRDFYDEPVLVGQIERWAARGHGGALPAYVSTQELMEKVLGIINVTEQAKSYKALSDSMRHLGFKRSRRSVDGERARGWEKMDAPDSAIREAILARRRVDRATHGGQLLN